MTPAPMRPRPFTRLAIVNRGEPAMRLIHAVRELNRETPERRIHVIALHTTAEREAMFVRHADEAVALGPGGYLDHAGLRIALREARADAVWVGWGFVAEQAEFVELCDELGIVFVGPGADVMRRVGDKIAAKRLAEDADVPVAPWSGGPVQDAAEAVRQGDRIGFPLMIKAAAGGGGRGIRRVERREDIPAAFAGARAEAVQAFGDGTLLLERLIAPARHIEVQVIADGRGTAWAVGLRDCSYQRRNQKVIEESASPALTAAQEREIKEAARRLALRAGYRNAGTVEFLYEPASRRFSFMEVNARLQVEHPVTEAVTGVDLVKLQLQVAAGGRLGGDPPPSFGHAIEARLNAEDPALGFAPAPGRVAMLRLPTGPGVRVDAGVAEGDVIPPDFDSMIAKVIAWGRDRTEALARLRRALADTMVVIEGGTTNQGFLLRLLDRPELRSGDVDTTWLDRLHLSGEIASHEHADVALLQAAVELAEADTEAERSRFYAFARRGRPQSAAPLARTVELRHRGNLYRFAVAEVAPHRYRMTIDGASVEVASHRLGPHERRLEVPGRAYRTLASLQGADLLIEVDGVPHRVSRDDRGFVRNLGPAIVVSVPVQVGDEVEAGEVVAVVESMKMESSLTAPFRGRVRRVLAAPNVHVGAQEPLVQLEPDEAAVAGASTADRVSFAAAAVVAGPEPGLRCLENLRRLEWLTLGYDIGADEVRRVLEDLHGACADLSCHPALIPGEHRLLELYADIRALSDPRHDEGDPEADVLRSPEQHLHAFLRSLDAEGEALPRRFTLALGRALARFGIESLDRTPALEDACYRLFLAHERADAARAAVLAILDRRLEVADELMESVGDDFRHALDQLLAAAEGSDPILSDLARRVRFRYFDEPVIEAAREQVYAAASLDLDALAADPARADRGERIDALVACPRPLAPTLAHRMHGADEPFRRLLLETIARRFYRVRDLDAFAEEAVDGHRFLTSHYRHEGGPRRRLITASTHLDQLATTLRGFAALAEQTPVDELTVGDIYARQEDDATLDELAGRIRAALADVALPERVRRVVVAVTRPGMGRGMSAMVPFTFRPGPDGLAEDDVLRGIHPMMSHRLRLARLSEFTLERLPAAEDVYFFHGAARANPRDERLFAVAEVRDLTPVRDAAGTVTRLPELERMLVQALEAIRGYQSHRKPSRRPQWNRIVLHAWPVIELSPEEIRVLVGRLSPSTAGLGIEMVIVYGRVRDAGGAVRPRVLRFFAPGGGDVVVEVDDVPTEPLKPIDEGVRRMVAARRRGLLHPAEIVKLLAPAHRDAAHARQPVGEFVEHDLDDHGELVPVARPAARNPAGIVVGLIRNFTERHPEGMLRLALLGDPTKALGSLAEPECRRIIAALDMAERLRVPVEWFALSAGAKIAMDSGTENMDWIAAVLRRIIEFTQRGGELNVVVTGINVGAQPYWNAEATMLMHTKGILVMTPQSAMVLTGKQALDYSGGVSAEDNLGIGGYERIMGPNGQAQYWAPDVPAACRLLLDYYEHTYVAPGERFPRRAHTSDPADRDIASAPHRAPDSDLPHVGDVLSDAGNPGRKKPFDMRSIMRAVTDLDHEPLERWGGMRDAEVAVVWDAHLGGRPVSLIGIESRPLARMGIVPADGPEQWTSGTLFPRASKKVARAINAASGRRPLVVLANLAGFDGSPESMREWQLEFGAEIGRAVVNFDGPIVFCVVSRYHGGAFVVFSQRLNEQLEAVALEGAHASVIGGAPAAAVVFAREVEQAAARDQRIVALDEQIGAAQGAERTRLREQRAGLWDTVLAEHRGAFATEFDTVHSVERAVAMGSVSGVIAPATLRPYLIDAVERGIRKRLAQAAEDDGRLAHGIRG